ncbi:MAG TPA: hypothetical protein VFQ80_08980, partial [Thermomicrobiales bacterium]|nr:hypothetical protein [Thermomicrobiales bacterium]
YAHTGAIGTYLASSASEPGVLYCVVIDPRSKSYGCDCQGWERHRRCKHFALALEAAGWLPEPPEPEGGAPAPQVRIPRDPADIEAAMQRIRDNAALARLAAAAIAERRSLGLVREETPAYDAAAGCRPPMAGDCPRCGGAIWEKCPTCAGSGVCPTCRGDGLWHTGLDHDERVIGPDGAAWICPDCAKFRAAVGVANDPAGVVIVGRVAEEEPVYQVGPVEPRPEGCGGFSTLGFVKRFAAREAADDARKRRGGLPVRGEPVWREAADALEAEWLAALRRRLADRRSN